MILNGWKEVANYMGRGVRTVQRWEKLGLPLHRPNSRLRSAVITTSEELDAWLAKCVNGRPADAPADSHSEQVRMNFQPYRVGAPAAVADSTLSDCAEDRAQTEMYRAHIQVQLVRASAAIAEMRRLRERTIEMREQICNIRAATEDMRRRFQSRRVPDLESKAGGAAVA